MPFAGLASGLLRGPGEAAWGTIFLEVMHRWLREAGVQYFEDVDFCLPAMSADGAVIHGTCAEIWHVAPLLKFLLARAGIADAHLFSVHGIKATMLAWSGQVAAVPKDSRRRQGHHAGDVVS